MHQTFPYCPSFSLFILLQERSKIKRLKFASSFTSPDFFFKFFLCYEVFAKQKKTERSTIYYSYRAVLVGFAGGMREPYQRSKDSTLRTTAVAPSVTCHSHTFILAAFLDIAKKNVAQPSSSSGRASVI